MIKHSIQIEIIANLEFYHLWVWNPCFAHKNSVVGTVYRELTTTYWMTIICYYELLDIIVLVRSGHVGEGCLCIARDIFSVWTLKTRVFPPFVYFVQK